MDHSKPSSLQAVQIHPVITLFLALFLGTGLTLTVFGCGGDTTGSQGFKTWTVNLAGDADHRSVQACIDEASSGDTCLVYPGVYKGTVRFKGKAVKVISLNGPRETVLDPGDIDQDGLGDDTVVRFVDNEKPGAILDGFTVTRGHAQDHGGGIYIESASPTVRNCILVENSAEGDGGGLYCVGSTARPLIFHSIFYKNAAGGRGGAVSALYASPDLVNCLFFDNTAFRGGAVSVLQRSSVNIRSSTVADNAATEYGGGIYLSDATAVVVNGIIWGNVARSGPGPQAYLEWSAAPETTRFYARYTDLEGGRAAVFGGDLDCDAAPAAGLCMGAEELLQDPPLFVSLDADLPPQQQDPTLAYYLSEPATGRTDQTALGRSPCIDRGDPDLLVSELGIEGRTTRTDQEPDAVPADLGYHYEGTE